MNKTKEVKKEKKMQTVKTLSKENQEDWKEKLKAAGEKKMTTAKEVKKEEKRTEEMVQAIRAGGKITDRILTGKETKSKNEKKVQKKVVDKALKVVKKGSKWTPEKKAKTNGFAGKEKRVSVKKEKAKKKIYRNAEVDELFKKCAKAVNVLDLGMIAKNESGSLQIETDGKGYLIISGFERKLRGEEKQVNAIRFEKFDVKKQRVPCKVWLYVSVGVLRTLLTIEKELS